MTDTLTRNRVADLGELGLAPYPARVLLALLDQPGQSVSSLELANRSGVPRTSIYHAAEALQRLGLAERVAVVGPARWRCAGWPAVHEVLAAIARDRYTAQLAIVRRLHAGDLTNEPATAGKDT